MYFHYYISLSSPHGKDNALHLKKFPVILFIQGCFVPSLTETGPAVLEKKIF